MNAKVDELMRLVDAYADEFADGIFGESDPGETRTALLAALEAALKPGEPVAFRLRNTAFRTEVFEYFRTRFAAECRQMQFNASVDDGGLHELTPLYTVAPAPTPDVLSIYDKAIDKLQSQVDAFTAALPAIKEVIRISDRKHDAWDAAKAAIAAFEFPPAQTPPPRLTDEQVKKFGVLPGTVRAIESAVRKQAGWEE